MPGGMGILASVGINSGAGVAGDADPLMAEMSKRLIWSSLDILKEGNYLKSYQRDSQKNQSS